MQDKKQSTVGEQTTTALVIFAAFILRGMQFRLDYQEPPHRPNKKATQKTQPAARVLPPVQLLHEY